MDYSFNTKMAESQTAEHLALAIINKELDSSFQSTANTEMDLHNCVDFTDGKINIAWRHLSDKYGHEPTMKITQITNGNERKTEYSKIIGNQSLAHYHLYTFHSGNPSSISAWILIDSLKLKEYLQFYRQHKFIGKKTWGNECYTFLKIRPIFLKQIGAIVKDSNYKSSPSYNNSILDGGINETLYWADAIRSFHVDKIESLTTII